VNFNKESLENTTYSFEYDYGSIMHYGQFYFRSEISHFPFFWPVHNSPSLHELYKIKRECKI
jgi:hypothetical protein